MAIQFARCEYVSRTTGGNACRKAAYNQRESIRCERTGELFSFKERGGNIYHDVLLPQGADPKFKNSTILWNEAERCERRKDSQVCKELVIALPDDKQLTFEDRIELAHRFAQANFVDKGVAVQIDLHEPDLEERNWHAHLLVTTRRFSEDGQSFSLKKATDLDPLVRGRSHRVMEADLWGEIWRDTQNTYFEEKGYDMRVDPIGIIAQEHLGPVRMRHHLNQAIARSQELQKANEKLSHHPDAILEALTRHTAIFTKRDIEIFLNKHVPIEGRKEVLEDVLNSLRILPLYDKETGYETEYFTTHEVRLEEEKLLRFADAISSKNRPVLPSWSIEKGIEERTLSQEQRKAYDLCVNTDKNLAIIQGRAGVGKSYLLNAVREAHENAGLRVIGLAPTHKVSMDLKESGFQNAKTCHGFLFAYKNNRASLDSNTLVIVDEAAMMGNSLTVELFNAIKKNGAKLILVGDDRQLSSVERGGAFGILSERYRDKAGAVELREVRRQTLNWQKAVSEDLSQGDIRSAVSLLEENNCIKWHPTKACPRESGEPDSMSELLKAWSKDSSKGAKQILAQRNIDVDALNEGAREILRKKGKLGDLEITCLTQRGKATFAVGDRIQLTKTDRDQKLENGTFGIIKEINPQSKLLTLQMDNGETKQVDPTNYDGLRHGYAATIYKAQGSTLDHVYVLHGKTTNQSTNYVALTRQTKSLFLYVSKDETPNPEALIRQMGRAEGKGTSLAFDTEKDIERKQREQSLMTKIKKGVEDVVTKVKDRFHKNEAFYHFEKPEQTKSDVTIQSHQEDLSSKKIEKEITQEKEIEKTYTKFRSLDSLAQSSQYFRESLKEELKELSQELLKGKDFMKDLKHQNTEEAKRIQNIAKEHDVALAKERDRDAPSL